MIQTLYELSFLSLNSNTAENAEVSLLSIKYISEDQDNHSLFFKSPSLLETISKLDINILIKNREFFFEIIFNTASNSSTQNKMLTSGIFETIGQIAKYCEENQISLLQHTLFLFLK